MGYKAFLVGVDREACAHYKHALDEHLPPEYSRVVYTGNNNDSRLLKACPMRNKWASCSTNGYLNFNAELLDLKQSLWDYVIVHELLHFSVPNHGKLWKSLMSAHLGDYKRAEAELRVQAGCADDIP